MILNTSIFEKNKLIWLNYI